METFGSESTFSMKNFFLSLDILTKLTDYVFGIVSNSLTKFGVNRNTISFSCHINDRFEINTVQRESGALTSLYGNRRLIGPNISRTNSKIKFYLIFSSYFDVFYRNPSSDLVAPDE